MVMSQDRPMTGERLSDVVTEIGGDVLARRLREKRARVAVLGLGYAGLPMAVELARAGYAVTGLDIDAERVRLLNSGRSPVSDVADAEVSSLVAEERLRASLDFGELADSDCAIICVPTPLTPDLKQDARFLEAAGRSIADHLHPGMLVVLQSTSAPGTTRRLLLPILEENSDLEVGRDFFVAFAPERIDPGNQRHTLQNTPKLAGGVTKRCGELAALLFAPIVERVITVSSPEAAEMAKLVENTFRFINISFANEMAVLCDRMGIDVWEVIDAAATKPFAFMAHYPGPGVGGHCIPVVPFFIEQVAHEHGMTAEFIEVAGRVNGEMPAFVVDKLARLLGEQGKPLLGASVLLLGVAYKADIGDWRDSPALLVLDVLRARGASVSYYDPHVARVPSGGASLESLTEQDAVAQRFDAALLLTPHRRVDYDRVLEGVDVVLDTRNYLSGHSRVQAVNL
jgi:UDP-N-acetyl-D-glucosamine dehydrogenase